MHFLCVISILTVQVNVVQFYDETWEVSQWLTTQAQQLTDYERRLDVSVEDGERILRDLQVTDLTVLLNLC